MPSATALISDVLWQKPEESRAFLVCPEGAHRELLEHVLEKIYLPINLYLDVDGSVNADYGQPGVGVPFGRGYVVAPDSTVTEVFVGYAPAAVLAELEAAMPHWP